MWPVFIGWINVFKTSPRLSRDVFRTLKTDCQICVFICPDKLLQGKKFPWKNVKFDFFSENGGGGGFFEFLGKKRNFGRKLSGELSERYSKFPEGLFEERDVFPKTFQIKKCFQTFSKISIFVVFWHVYVKIVPVSRWTCWGNFSLNKYLFRVCFRFWAEYCRTLTLTLQPIVKIAFYLYRLSFSWIFFCLEKDKQLDNFFRKWSGSSS